MRQTDTSEKMGKVHSYPVRRIFLSSSNKGTVAVVVPRVVAHNLDAHTGIPFMPHIAAHLAGALDQLGYYVQVIDCFGLQPHNRKRIGEFMLMGVSEDWVVKNLLPETQVVYLYCRTVEDLISTERLASAIRKARPQIKICLFENTQSVNSFSLRHIAGDLFKLGCNAAVLGEPERRADGVTQALMNGLSLESIPGLAYPLNGEIKFNPDAPFDTKLDELPFPLWERFPLEGYWIAGFAHPPVGRRKFLPILTSRGCPYRCTFCISPEVNPTWRGRSAKNVVDEMEYFYRKLGVTDYHVSDLDPTVNDRRTREICYELIARKLPITWKLAQGTKIETIKNEETLELMARAGCKFVAFSPETGSPKLIKIMNKPFDLDHGLRMCKKMNELGIRSQACFIAGVPGEEREDQDLSVAYVKKLVDVGLDEIAVYVFTPLPGAELWNSMSGYTHYSQCTRSPVWRKDYHAIQRYRYRMYLAFFLRKLTWPKKVLREIRSFIKGEFETKMEMSIYKQIKLYLLAYCPFLFRRLDADQKIKSLRAISS